jgi:hypothetical protein
VRNAVLFVFALPATFLAQEPLGGPVAQQDLARLNGAGDGDFSCEVQTVKPELGFDLKLHTGYTISFPLRELAGGSGGTLSAVLRVAPDEPNAQATYMVQRFQAPPLPDNVKGSTDLHGVFDVGPGRYRADLIVRAPGQRACVERWKFTAKVARRDRDVPLALAPNSVAEPEADPFMSPPREGGGTLRVRILANFTPQDQSRATLSPDEEQALTGMLRRIGRDRRIGQFSVVGFTLRDRAILYRREKAASLDLPELGRAIRGHKGGTIGVNKLERSDGQFLTRLLREQIEAAGRADAVIFVGSRAMLDPDAPGLRLGEVDAPAYPVFSLTYNSNPVENPFRDNIGKVVKVLKGREYPITRPHDLWTAWQDVMSRLVPAQTPAGVETAAR